MFTAQLFNYAGLVGGIEIAADGTISIPSVVGKDYLDAPGFATTSSLAGQFSFTYALDTEHYIHTHGHNYSGSLIKEYYAFAIAWKGASNPVYLPLIRR